MKGDYSRRGVMPSRYLKQIDLPSAYLVYAVGKASPGRYNFTLAAHCYAFLTSIGRSLGGFSENYGYY
jgi:hypothetical protein